MNCITTSTVISSHSFGSHHHGHIYSFPLIASPRSYLLIHLDRITTDISTHSFGLHHQGHIHSFIWTASPRTYPLIHLDCITTVISSHSFGLYHHGHIYSFIWIASPRTYLFIPFDCITMVISFHSFGLHHHGHIDLFIHLFYSFIQCILVLIHATSAYQCISAAFLCISCVSMYATPAFRCISTGFCGIAAFINTHIYNYHITRASPPHGLASSPSYSSGPGLVPARCTVQASVPLGPQESYHRGLPVN